MATKYSRKIFGEDGIYYVFNRGVNKCEIFIDDRDYKVFIHNIRRYLDPEYKLKKVDPKTGEDFYMLPKKLCDKVSLLTFCLMPNHFHLILKLKEKTGMSELMQSLLSNYTTYFNDKYCRTDKLYGDVYKAVRVTSEPQYLQLSRYIHLNPLKIIKSELEDYQYSGFYYIFNNLSNLWLHWENVLLDNSRQQYIDFVKSKESKKYTRQDKELLENVVIEELK